MRNRLSISRGEAASRIDKLVERGEELVRDAPVDHASWAEWTRAFERWQLVGRDALATTFEGTNEADEFYAAATSGIVRQWGGQSDDETFANQQEAIASALNILHSLKERLEFAALPSVVTSGQVEPAETGRPAKSEVTEDRVFVVHGRNTVARDGVFDFLRAIGLHPIDWSEAVKLTGKGSPYIGEVLGAAFTEAKAVVVLMTRTRLPFCATNTPTNQTSQTSNPVGSRGRTCSSRQAWHSVAIPTGRSWCSWESFGSSRTSPVVTRFG